MTVLPDHSLPTIQRWMQAVIQHPNGVEAGVAAQACLSVTVETLETVVPRTSLQTSTQRLQIYADAYFARLLEVLRSEFPALAHALGEELFAEFVAGYLQDYPASSYTLSDLGAKFPEHLVATRPPREADEPDWADFLIDCCRLERLYAEVFDGPGPEFWFDTAIQPDWANIDPGEFAASRLVLAPWVRLIALRYPVHEYISATRRQESPQIPAPRATWLVVSRREYVVRRAPVPSAEFYLLTALRSGVPVGTALASLAASDGGDDITVDAVEGWFAAWAAAGYLEGWTDP